MNASERIRVMKEYADEMELRWKTYVPHHANKKVDDENISFFKHQYFLFTKNATILEFELLIEKEHPELP
ncbi:MAG: hypothetical protein WCT49_06170 [Candidatus Paceibacterota bacterium]|jgi:hypothetical protein|nr:hypothetical protein [Candidatus Paceibacterota bacterium]